MAITPGDARHATSEPAGALAIRSEIVAAIREARQARNLTQAQLADLVGTNRTRINRIETGLINAPKSLLERLAASLEIPHILELAERQTSLDSTDQADRDNTVERLLNRPEIESVQIVVADNIDIYSLIYNDGQRSQLANARSVSIVFPTAAREEQLFGELPILSFLEYQIKRLADLQSSDSRQGVSNLLLFESDAVLASTVVVNTKSGSECAYWPPIRHGSSAREDDSLPVARSADANVIARFRTYVDSLTLPKNRIRKNEALVRVAGPGDASARSELFTRFFQVGRDQEEEVSRDEGFVIALILTVARCPRGKYGMARRLVTYKRPGARNDRERLSLFSNNVEDSDIYAARDDLVNAGDHLSSRSKVSALAAAYNVDEYIRSHNGEIPDRAYQIAAAREFQTFRLNVNPTRFVRLPLPPDLQMIRKPATHGVQRAAIAPRLFLLELEALGQRPELDLLDSVADIEVLGTSDLEGDESRLNDFLLQSRDLGYLIPALNELEVAAR